MDKIDKFFAIFYASVILFIILVLWKSSKFSLIDWIWAEHGETIMETEVEVSPDGDISIKPTPSHDLMNPTDPSVDHDEFSGSKGDHTLGVYFRKNSGVSDANDQETFLSRHLQPADQVGGEHGYPLEGMRSGGYIPLPYSVRTGITTNEDLAINI